MTDKITAQAKVSFLADHPNWKEVDGRDAIAAKLKFDDFATAFSFMTHIAIEAEKADHHPEWFNVYNKVEITLSTHDAGGVTQKDTDLAALIDTIAHRLRQK